MNTNTTNNTTTTTTDFNTMYTNAENAIKDRFAREFKAAEKSKVRRIDISETGSIVRWWYDKNLRSWTIITFGPSQSVSDGMVNCIDQIDEAQYSNTKATLRLDVLDAVVVEIVRVTQMLLGHHDIDADVDGHVTTAWLCDLDNNELLEDNNEDSLDVKTNWWLGNLLGLVARVDPTSDFAKESKARGLMVSIDWRRDEALRDRDNCVQNFKDASTHGDNTDAADELCRIMDWSGQKLAEATTTARILGNFKTHLTNCIEAHNWVGVTGLCKDGLASATNTLGSSIGQNKKKVARDIMELCGEYLGVTVNDWTANCGDQYATNRYGFSI